MIDIWHGVDTMNMIRAQQSDHRAESMLRSDWSGGSDPGLWLVEPTDDAIAVCPGLISEYHNIW